MASSISSPGVSSGLDVNSIVSQLMAVERTPLTRLQAQETKIDSKISAFGKLQSAVSTLQDAARALSTATTWQAATATASDPTAAAVAVNGAPASGSYSLRVDQLAQRQTAASGMLAGATAPFAAGTLQFQMGRLDGAGAFAADAARAPLSVTVADGDTLTQVRDKINAAGAGVAASIVNDGTGVRLMMRSSESGAAQAFKITATQTGSAGTGLSALAFDPSAGGSGGLTQTLAARDAAFSIDGLALASPTNRVTGALEGVAIDLRKAGPDPIDVQVLRDTPALKASVKKFTEAYNALNTLVAEQTKYDPATKKAAALQGDSIVTGLQSRLRNVLHEQIAGAATGEFARLSDIGIAVQKDGSLGIDETRLDAALASPDKVRALFSAGGTDPARVGFGQRFNKVATEILGTSGPINTATSSMQRTKKGLDDRQADIERRLASTEERMLRQYNKLDETMSKMKSLDFSRFYTTYSDAKNQGR